MGGRPLFFYELDPRSQFQFLRNEILRLSGWDKAVPHVEASPYSDVQLTATGSVRSRSAELANIALWGSLPIAAALSVRVLARQAWGVLAVTSERGATFWVLFVFVCSAVATLCQGLSAFLEWREQDYYEAKIKYASSKLWRLHATALLSEAEQKETHPELVFRDEEAQHILKGGAA